MREHAEGSSELIGAELVEKALDEKLEKDRSRGLTELAALAPAVLEDFHKGDI